MYFSCIFLFQGLEKDNVKNSGNMAEYMEYEWRAQNIASSNFPWKFDRYQDRTISKNHLRDLISKSSEIEFRGEPPPEDDELIRFLYARRFDPEQTYQLMLAYRRHRHQNSRLLGNLSASAPDVLALLSSGLPAVLPSRDRRGRKIIVLSSDKWDSLWPLASVYRALLTTLEYLTAADSGKMENLANGFIVIVDWTEFPFSRSSQLTPSALRLFIEGLQDCFPARFKGVHFVNQPWYVEAALMVIRRFLRDDTADKIHVHGNNLSTLHEHVHQDVLPAELGGERPSYDPKPWLTEITSYFRTHNKTYGT